MGGARQGRGHGFPRTREGGKSRGEALSAGPLGSVEGWVCPAKTEKKARSPPQAREQHKRLRRYRSGMGKEQADESRVCIVPNETPLKDCDHKPCAGTETKKEGQLSTDIESENCTTVSNSIRAGDLDSNRPGFKLDQEGAPKGRNSRRHIQRYKGISYRSSSTRRNPLRCRAFEWEEPR